MFTFPLPLMGPAMVSLETLRADPTLVLKKFPLAKAITQVVAGEYLIETYPLAITSRIPSPKFIVVKMEVTPTQIVFAAPSDKSAYPRFDGWLEGSMEAINDDIAKMSITIQLQTPFSLGIPDAVMKNAVLVLSAQLANQFNANLVNVAFANTVPA